MTKLKHADGEMDPVIYQFRIFRTDLRLNPDVTYVFGDNMRRVGFGGQAKEMRGEPNAFGIPTLWGPGVPFRAHDIHTAREAWEGCCRDLLEIIEADELIVFPAEGVGTGFANMNAGLRRLLDSMLLDLGIVNDIASKLNKPVINYQDGEPS